jgi:pimeloyl-ACP methyl ester carboxylesterase
MKLLRSSASAALAWVMALVSLALPATAVVTQDQAAPPPFPPPGKLVDVGGWRLHPLGDMPLIVLTREKSEEEGPDGKAFEAEHRRDHTAMAAMSRNGKLIIATRSGHHVQLDEPELVVKAIRDALAAARK